MHCGQCGTQLLPGKAFCHVCGTPAGPRCPACGAPSDPGFQFCPDCGTPASAASDRRAPAPPRAAPPDPPPPSRPDPPRPATPVTGERKQVTVLFCDIAGSTPIAERLDPEDYRDLLDRYLEIALREIDRMGGVVNQLAGDGLMALFGAPIAHEGAPERAVRAALGIQEALEPLSREYAGRDVELRARVGVHAGPVVVGTVGNDLKMDYTAIGDATNLAARLEELAPPGAILISDAVRRSVEGLFELRPLGAVDVRGKSEPVTAYEVLGAVEASPMARAAERGLTPLVGVQHELAQLESCFQRLEGKLPQLVSVVGDPGSGKSRLVYELKQRLAERDAHVLEGRCSPLARTVPFTPFVTMLKGFFGLAPGESPECACDKIAGRLRSLDAELDAIYAPLCQLLTTPVESATADSSAEGLRQRVFDACELLFQTLARTAPIVMIMEDLHWIDEASRELLELAVGRIERAPIMIVVTHRRDYEPRWRPNAVLTQIALRPLADADAVEIVRARSGGPLPPELERRILRHAEGNPFFVEETTRALLEEGQVVRDEGGVKLARPPQAIQIPQTVQELIAARLDRLSPRAKRLAQVASVFGRQFRAGHLQALLDAESDGVDPGLRELEERGVVHTVGADEGDEYRFGESLTQTVAYEGLLLRERRELHERVAGLLERDPRGVNAERAGLIAHHLAHSENRSRAIDSLLVAAQNAEDMPSYPSAAALYAEVWDLAEAELAEHPGSEEAQRRVLDAVLGVCRIAILYSGHDTAAVERAARRGRELAEALGDTEALARVVTEHGMMIAGASQDRFVEGLELIEHGVELARRVDDVRSTPSILRALAWSYLLDGQFGRAREVLAEALARLDAVGESSPPSDLYLSLLYFESMAALLGDDLAGAERSAARTHELCVSARNRTLESSSAAVLAQVRFLRADYAGARDWADRSLATAQAIGNVGALRTSAAVALGSRLELGESAALGRFLEAIDQTVGASSDLGTNGQLLVEVLLQAGELERAARCAELTVARAGGRLRQLIAEISTAQVAERASAHRPQAAEAYARAAALAGEIGVRSAEAVASLGLARLAAERGARDEAERLRGDAADLSAAAGCERYRRTALEAVPEPGPSPGNIPPRVTTPH